MCILPPPYGPTHQNYHAKLFNNRAVSQLYIDGENRYICTFQFGFRRSRPFNLVRFGPSKKKTPSAVQLSLTPTPEPSQLEVLHTFQAPSCNRFIISLFYQVASNANLGVFPPFFPAVKLRDPMHTAKKHFSMYVQYIQYRVQSWLNSRIVSCDGDGVSFPQSV